MRVVSGRGGSITLLHTHYIRLAARESLDYMTDARVAALPLHKLHLPASQEQA